jgi:hypothetical protein
MAVTNDDVMQAKNEQILELLNQVMTLRAQVASLQREQHTHEADPALDEAMANHPSNGKVDRTLSVAAPE